ncbi:MAG TPA: hypothetical protein VG498_03705 [Terriglobales bacterium]|nr:hypothetical protein [Terriglobales bacterium]
MPDHNRFEELCALAVTGQISAGDSAELEAHLKTCETCRKAQADFVEIESMWLSAPHEPSLHTYELSSTLTQRILCRMRGAGARFSKPVLKNFAGRPAIFSIPLRSSRVSAYIAGGLALLVVGAALGVEFSQHVTPPERKEVAAHMGTVVSAPPIVAQNLSEDAELIAAHDAEEQLRQKLAAAESESSRALARLHKAERKLADLQSARERDGVEIAALRFMVDKSRADAQNAQFELAKLKETQASRDADFIAAQFRARVAEDKLAEQYAAGERERQLLSAGREIRDVIGARNLHIVDVADVGTSGVKRPFGRVFYTEGKSLIFYAYDLANPKGKQALYAWGQREGDPHSTRMLGLVYNDDKAQKRWAFKFDDPRVLAEIDSVFVTLEPNDMPSESPKGKKLLKAFLGTPPNHP